MASHLHNPPHPGAVLREWLPESMKLLVVAATMSRFAASVFRYLFTMTALMFFGSKPP